MSQLAVWSLSMGLGCGVFLTYGWVFFLQGLEYLRNHRAERGSIFLLIGLALMMAFVPGMLYKYQPPGDGYDNEILAMGWLGAMAIMSTFGLLCAWFERRRQRVASQMAHSTIVEQRVNTEVVSPSTEPKKMSVDLSIFSRHRVTESKS